MKCRCITGIVNFRNEKAEESGLKGGKIYRNDKLLHFMWRSLTLLKI